MALETQAPETAEKSFNGKFVVIWQANEERDMYATLKAGVLGAQRALSFPFSRRTDGDVDDLNDVHLVAQALRRYREKQKEQESIIVESALPLESSSEHLIRGLVGADDTVRIQHRVNFALLNRVQIYYNGNVYMSPPINSIDRLKSLL